MRTSGLQLLAITVALATSPAAAMAQSDLLILAETAAREARIAATAADRAARNAEAALAALKAERAGTAVLPGAAPATFPMEPTLGTENMSIESKPSDLRAIDAAAFHRALGGSVANGLNDGLLKAGETPDLQFSLSDKDKVASVSVSFDKSTTTNDHFLLTEQFTLSGSSKLDDDGGASLAGLKGFSNGTDVSATYTSFRTPVVWSKTSRPQVEAARANCLVEKKGVRARGLNEADTAKAAEEEAKACDPYSYATGAGDFTARYNPVQYRELLNSALPGRVDFYGLKVTGNQAAYKYLNRAAFKEESDSHFGFSASVFGGALLKNGQTAFTGSFTYKRDYEAADPVDLCQAVPETALTQCISSADGEPERKNQAILALEGRYAFKTEAGIFTKLAIAPELSVDVNHGAYSVTLPLYFAGDSSGKLRAGLRGVYTNEKGEDGGRDDDFQLGVFIGSPFSLLPN